MEEKSRTKLTFIGKGKRLEVELVRAYIEDEVITDEEGNIYAYREGDEWVLTAMNNEREGERYNYVSSKRIIPKQPVVMPIYRHAIRW